MTSSMMSAVPPNRAGQGSSMNDATRELGAALGVAVLGSIATSHYATAIADSARSLPGRGRRCRHQVHRRRARCRVAAPR